MTEVKFTPKFPQIWEYLFIVDDEVLAKVEVQLVKAKKVNDSIKVDLLFKIDEEEETEIGKFRFVAKQTDLDYYRKGLAPMEFLYFLFKRNTFLGFYHGIVHFGYYPIVRLNEIMPLYAGAYGIKMKTYIEQFSENEFFDATWAGRRSLHDTLSNG
jgi:hypothetical protein